MIPNGIDEKLTHAFLNVLRKSLPKHIEIRDFRNEHSTAYNTTYITDNADIMLLDFEFSYFAFKSVINRSAAVCLDIDEFLYHIVKDIADEALCKSINCYFVRDYVKPILYVSPNVTLEVSFDMLDYILTTYWKAVMFAPAAICDKVVSNKLKAILNLESKGYYKTKLPISDVIRYYEAASNR